MIEGVYVDNIMMHSETRVYPTQPQITAGLIVGTQAIYRYALRESSYPTLSLVDELSDGQGNVIPPGHYELALSDDRDFLILIQSKQPIAIIPVFKGPEAGFSFDLRSAYVPRGRYEVPIRAA